MRIVNNEVSKILKDESGQAQLEYILVLIVGIVLAIVALLLYKSYFTNQSL